MRRLIARLQLEWEFYRDEGLVEYLYLTFDCIRTRIRYRASYSTDAEGRLVLWLTPRS